MALQLYRRHTQACVKSRQEAGDKRSSKELQYDRAHRRCKCPIQAEGTLRIDGFIRKSTGETDWTFAEEIKRASEHAGTWQPQPYVKKDSLTDAPLPASDQMTVKRAIEEFMLARKVAKRSPATLSKYGVLLKRNRTTPMAALLPFCENRGWVFLTQMVPAVLTQFMSQWTDEANAGLKKHERLWSFFEFCKTRGYLSVNPVTGMSKPAPKPTIKEPFTQAEIDRMLDAFHIYPDNYGNMDCNNSKRLRAMLLLLRYSGLAIGDAVSLRRDRLTGRALMTHRRKTGGEVYVPLPDVALEALDTMPNTYKGKWSEAHPDYFFWTGRGLIKSAVANWQRSFRKLFKLANIVGAHPHRFRHTFAVDLLERGVPMEDVSMMLGHSSVTITEQHYAKWVKARQQALEARVLAAWEDDSKVRSIAKRKGAA